MTASQTCVKPASRDELAEIGREFQIWPGVVFLNHGSYGACPRPVFEVYQQWQRELEANPVEILGRRLKPLLAEARARLAAFLGTHRDNLVFVPNATTGANVVARSLELGPGDEVLATDHEYGAVERTWRFVCEGTGARYVRRSVPLPVTSREEIVERVLEGVTERTKLVSTVTSRLPRR